MFGIASPLAVEVSTAQSRATTAQPRRCAFAMGWRALAGSARLSATIGTCPSVRTSSLKSECRFEGYARVATGASLPADPPIVNRVSLFCSRAAGFCECERAELVGRLMLAAHYPAPHRWSFPRTTAT